MAKEKTAKPVTAVKLQWEEAGDLPTLYANQLIISHVTGEEFYLVFGEASPPLGLVSGEPIEAVNIRPVAKVAIASSAMVRLSAAIQQNVSQFLEVVREAKEREDAEQSD